MNFNVGFTVPDWACVLITICFIAILVIRIFKMIPPKIYHKISLCLFYHNSERYRANKIKRRETNGDILIMKEDNERQIKQKISFDKRREKLKHNSKKSEED